MIKIATKKKLFSARVSELARLESAAALAVCSSVAALLQLCCSSVAVCCSSVAALLQLCRVASASSLELKDSNLLQLSQSAALLQLCCSSVAALLQSRVSELARILMISDSLFAVKSDKT
jgi:hypothetical protein